MSAAFTVVVAEPLLIAKLTPAPVTVSVNASPIVTIPDVVVIALVPDPPSVRFPFKVTTPVLVVIFPAFQSIGPVTVNEASVLVAATKLWPRLNVPVVVKVTGSLKDRLACEVMSPEMLPPPIVIAVKPSAKLPNSAAVRFITLADELSVVPR